MGTRNAILVCRTHADHSTGTFGWAPYGDTKRCTGWLKRREERGGGHETLYWLCGTHVDGSTWTFGGAPYGAMKR
eukprot:4895439-Pyramimonas_sp.AAC.1